MPVALRSLAVVAVAAAVAVGVGAGSPADPVGAAEAASEAGTPGRTPPPIDVGALAAINALLDQREAAVRTGDGAAWMATVDPQAPPELRRAQQQLFDGWRSLPLASFALEATVEDLGNLGSALSGRMLRYGADQTFLPETRRRYRLAGYDETDAVEHLWYTYVRRGDRWYVGGTSDLEHLGLDTAVNLWDFGPVRVLPTEHFLVLSHPEQASRADELAAVAERAMQRFRQVWDRPWDERLPIVVPRSVDELERILQTTFDLDNFVAFVAYDVVRDDGYEPTAPRMYIQDRNLARHSARFQFDTLVHELVHAATAGASGPHVQAWVHEGLAEWVTQGRHHRGGVPGGSDGTVPEPYEFTTGGSGSILRAYRESEAAVAFLAERHGDDAPVRLFEALGQRRTTAGSADHNTSVALEAVTGAGLDAFTAAWAS